MLSAIRLIGKEISKLFNFNCAASLTISQEDVRKLVQQKIKEVYGLDIPIERLEESYRGEEYDQGDFDGYEIELGMDEVLSIRGLG
jgi:hypothetical protein